MGLNNFIEQEPKLFLSRLSKGPPPQFRFLAWRVLASRHLKRQKGLYYELLEKSYQCDEWTHDIEKDLNWTFPRLPFFNIEKYGDLGQKSLYNVLKAYSYYNKKVGYCQSMNFIVGFILLLANGDESDTFWFFTFIL